MNPRLQKKIYAIVDIEVPNCLVMVLESEEAILSSLDPEYFLHFLHTFLFKTHFLD